MDTVSTLAASRMRWDERQRLMVTQEEKARRDVQKVDDEINQHWTAVKRWTAKRMLKYLDQHWRIEGTSLVSRRVELQHSAHCEADEK